MIVLLAIGFAAGVITAVSPCVLPVLPILLAGGASGGGRRPYAIIAGLVASFTLFTLTAAAILSALGLPQDLLRNIAIEDTHGSQAIRRDVIHKILMNGGEPTLGPALQLMSSIMGRNAARHVGLMKPPVLTGLNRSR